MNDLFFNTSIQSEKSCILELCANHCFAPIRYFFNGRTIEILDQKVVFDHQTYAKHNWKRTALAIATLPAVIIGLVAKLFSYCYSSSRINRQITLDYLNKPFTPAELLLQDVISLDDSHSKLENKFADIQKKMTSEGIWDDHDFIHEVDVFMKEAFKEIQIFYHHLQEKHSKNLDKMAAVMQRQWEGENGLEEQLKDSTVYCFKYFYASLTEMYHLARCRAYVVNSKYQPIEYGWKLSRRLKNSEQRLYFNPQAVQCQWRGLYNAFCRKLDESGMSKRLTDGRFQNWSIPDTCFVDGYGFPDTRPTPPLGSKCREMDFF